MHVFSSIIMIRKATLLMLVLGADDRFGNAINGLLQRCAKKVVLRDSCCSGSLRL
jgi:hypothetical protein